MIKHKKKSKTLMLQIIRKRMYRTLYSLTLRVNDGGIQAYNKSPLF